MRNMPNSKSPIYSSKELFQLFSSLSTHTHLPKNKWALSLILPFSWQLSTVCYFSMLKTEELRTVFQVAWTKWAFSVNSVGEKISSAFGPCMRASSSD